MSAMSVESKITNKDLGGIGLLCQEPRLGVKKETKPDRVELGQLQGALLEFAC
jgi:hypothetical protein